MATAYNAINIETLRKNANREYKNKQYQFAFYLKYGFNQVPINLKEAFKYFKRASEQGHTGATAELGYLYYYGDGVKQNREKGIALLEQARIQGCARANYVLGNIYRKQGSNYDLKKADEASRHAVQSFKKQCTERKFDFKIMCAVVQHSLGFCYQSGEVVAQDVKEAVRYYRLAAQQGHARAQNNLGACYLNGKGVAQDVKEAVRYYRLAAQQGDAWAQNNLGCCYKKGEGVTQDFKEAVRYFRLAAQQGHAGAQNNLGDCYYSGEGVAQDFKEAVRYFRLTAQQGDAWAQNNLGCCYKKGEGVIQDFKEAVRYFRLAAQQGHAGAQNNLGDCYYSGEGVAQDFKEAVRYFRLAAQQGHAWAQYNLGICYQKGLGVPKNYKKAAWLFCLAKESEPSIMDIQNISVNDVEDFKRAMFFCKQITGEANQHTHTISNFFENSKTYFWSLFYKQTTEENKYLLSENIEKEIVKKYNYDQIRDFFESFNELGIKNRTEMTQNIENMQEMMNERFKNLSNKVHSYLLKEFNVHKDVSNILFQYTGMMFDSNSKRMGLLKIETSKKRNQMAL